MSRLVYLWEHGETRKIQKYEEESDLSDFDQVNSKKEDLRHCPEEVRSKTRQEPSQECQQNELEEYRENEQEANIQEEEQEVTQTIHRVL